MVKKFVKDGSVAVLISSGYGAGWSTWGDSDSCFDGELAEAIYNDPEMKDFKKISEIAEKNWPEQYQGGLEDCYIKWVPIGVQFEIDEYDGNESLTYVHQKRYMEA